MMRHLSFTEAEPQIQVGDVIAFGGSSHFSGIIKAAIRAEVSHIGIILEILGQDQPVGSSYHQIIDATASQGVAISRLRDRIDEYDGDVWWLPLHHNIREQRFDERAFQDFLSEQEGKEYDQLQAAGSAIDIFDQLPFGIRGPGYNAEDFEQFFCSELVAAGLKAAGMLPQGLNASEATPIDICRWAIYEPDYYLFKGEPSKEISGYNSISPLEVSEHASSSV